MEAMNPLFKLKIRLKNGKFSQARKVLKINRNTKISVKFQIIDEKTHFLKHEIYSKEIPLQEHFISFNNEFLEIDKVQYNDLLVISYHILGSPVKLTKLFAKIRKLKQNIKNEVVWIMDDDSFINLDYLLSINFNENNKFDSDNNIFNSTVKNTFNNNTFNNAFNNTFSDNINSTFNNNNTCNNTFSQPINNFQKITKSEIMKRPNDISITNSNIQKKFCSTTSNNYYETSDIDTSPNLNTMAYNSEYDEPMNVTMTDIQPKNLLDNFNERSASAINTNGHVASSFGTNIAPLILESITEKKKDCETFNNVKIAPPSPSPSSLSIKLENEYKILNNNKNINDPNNKYSKEYISTLKPNEYEYDTFCQAVIITGLSEKKMSLSKYSDNFPSSCEHTLCSKLPALNPSILKSYQNKNKKYIVDIQNTTAHLVFPLGIKICISKDFQNQDLSNDPIINTIYNEKGDIYYIASLTYYKKIKRATFDKIFNINPLNVFFQLNKENPFAQLIPNLGPNDILYIPECLSLISRFPFFNQLSLCLKTIVNICNHDDNNYSNVLLFINHIINQIPIGNNKKNILFYTPFNIEPVILYDPFTYNFENFQCLNIFQILSIENIITIFLLILLEQKIIFIDFRHKLLSAITFFFINLIYPLQWSSTYEPILSLSTIQYVQSITPFIMGSNEALIKYAYIKKYIIYDEESKVVDRSNIVFVSLKNDLINCDCESLIIKKKGTSRKNILKYLGLPDLPKSFEKKITNDLNDIQTNNNPKVINTKIKTLFCKIMVLILGNYKEHLVLTYDAPSFNKENFIWSKKEDKHLFYKELTNTQSFTQFILSQNELYRNEKKNKNKFSGYGTVHDGLYIDFSFFLKVKKKIDYIRLMTQRKKERPLLNAKKLVKNIGNMISGLRDSSRKKSKSKPKKSNDSSTSKKKEKEKNNISNKKNEGGAEQVETITNVVLMPYFMEETIDDLTDKQKHEYIKNKLSTIIVLDNQIKNNNYYKNQYIYNFENNLNLDNIKDDLSRYFIGTLKTNKRNNMIRNNSGSNTTLPYLTSSGSYSASNNDSSSKRDAQNSDKNNNKPILKNNNNNINKKSLFNNNENEGKGNSSNEGGEESVKKNNIIFLSSNQELNKEGKEQKKICGWFIEVCSASFKKKLHITCDIVEELKDPNNRKFFSKLIAQNYKSLRDINKKGYNYLDNLSIFELLKKSRIVLSFISKTEFKTCKYITLSLFRYYSYFGEHQKTQFLFDKYNEVYAPFPFWEDKAFWKRWFEEDINYIDQNLNKSRLLNISLDDDEFDCYNFLDEEENNRSEEYNLLIIIYKVMTSLKLNQKLIKSLIIDDLGSSSLTDYEMDFLKSELNQE